MEVKKYYISYQKEITQNSLNVCDLVKDISFRKEFTVFPTVFFFLCHSNIRLSWLNC